MQKDASVLPPLGPPVRWSAACEIRTAEHDIRSVKRPVEGGALWCQQGYREPVTFMAHHRLPSVGIKPRVTRFLGRHVCQGANAMLEANEPIAYEAESG